VAQYFDTRQRPTRLGNRNANLTPAEAYPTKDGMIQVVMMNPDQYERFCTALGDSTLASDPRFATNDARLTHYDDFRARVERALAGATTAEWLERFEHASIAAGAVYEFDEVFADAQVKHLELIAEIEQPGYGTARMLNFPVRASVTPAAIRRPAPLLGQHTAEVLGELGVTSSEIDRLKTAGTIALAPAANGG
jgi:crotonobetainyl-CoA:carnitine CoA-transferase CaiB-like acyl-CoA transferase